MRKILCISILGAIASACKPINKVDSTSKGETFDPVDHIQCYYEYITGDDVGESDVNA